jgi:hypothetical protein
MGVADFRQLRVMPGILFVPAKDIGFRGVSVAGKVASDF